jgi:error-prone DNA polymerase
VVVRGPDVNASAATATLEPCPPSAGGAAVRLGIDYVRNVGEALAMTIAAGRPYSSMEDLVRRTRAPRPAVEALATAGAFDALTSSRSTPGSVSGIAPDSGAIPLTKGEGAGEGRRAALWAAGPVAEATADRLPGLVTGAAAPALPEMMPAEVTAADLWATGVSTGSHPVQFVRDDLHRLGAVSAEGLAAVDHGARVLVGGVVTHRQRPATAQGTIFVNLEDETGMVNVICPRGVWVRYRRVARASPGLLVGGRLERADGAISLVAERIQALPLPAAMRARDFR